MQEVFQLIQEQVEDQKNDEVEQLILDECHFKAFTPQLKKELEKYSNLLYLSLNDCQLKSLENFPHLPSLLKLDLLDNQLADDCLSHIAVNQKLQQLSLGGNQIKQIDSLKALKELADLREIDLLACPLTNIPEYRDKIFALLEQLEILDNMDQDNNIIESDDEGSSDEDELNPEDDDEDDEEEDYDDDEDDDEEDEEEEEQPKPRKK